MNAFIDVKPETKSPEPDLLLDWRVDIERISRRALEAFRSERPDPWTRIEAECVIQLIDAELIAMSNRQSRGEPVEATIRHLKALRTETLLAIKTLDAVERHSTSINAEPGAASPGGSATRGGDASFYPVATPEFLNAEGLAREPFSPQQRADTTMEDTSAR